MSEQVRRKKNVLLQLFSKYNFSQVFVSSISETDWNISIGERRNEFSSSMWRQLNPSIKVFSAVITEDKKEKRRGQCFDIKLNRKSSTHIGRGWAQILKHDCWLMHRSHPEKIIPSQSSDRALAKRDKIVPIGHIINTSHKNFIIHAVVCPRNFSYRVVNWISFKSKAARVDEMGNSIFKVIRFDCRMIENKFYADDLKSSDSFETNSFFHSTMNIFIYKRKYLLMRIERTSRIQSPPYQNLNIWLLINHTMDWTFLFALPYHIQQLE